MKLPENKQERQKLLILIGVISFGAIYAVWFMGYLPLLDKIREAGTESYALERDWNRATVQIRRMTEVRSSLEDLAENLVEHSEKHMLHPRLGNYLLSAREILSRHAAEQEITLVRTEEVGLASLPGGAAREANRSSFSVQGYSVAVMVDCSYEQFRSWMEAMEEENPLLSFSRLQIATRSDNPLLQRISFDVQWPVWVDASMRQTILDEAAALRADVQSEVEDL